jgi:hypothetical protein
MCTQHTPGPWKIADRTRYPWWNVTTQAGDYVAEVECDPDAPDESHANARLIAAAPELLAALNGVVNEFDRMNASRDDYDKLGETSGMSWARIIIAKVKQP